MPILVRRRVLGIELGHVCSVLVEIILSQLDYLLLEVYSLVRNAYQLKSISEQLG